MAAWKRGIVAVIGAAAAVGVAGGAGAEERTAFTVRCTVAGAELTITSNGPDPRLSVRGSRIAVSQFDGGIDCKGPEPTVTTINTISISGGDNVNLDLRRGPLAPGLTDEGDGSSEIEVAVGGASTEIVLGDRPDVVTMGALSGDRAGIDLNAGAEGAAGDADVIFEVPKHDFASHLLRLGRGEDHAVVDGGSGFTGAWPLDGGLAGGPGSDDLDLSGANDLDGLGLLIGAGGRDRLTGSLGGDLIDGGPGPDRISAGRGGDLVATFGGGHDRADCGPGDDYLAYGKEDSFRHCEDREKYGPSGPELPPPPDPINRR